MRIAVTGASGFSGGAVATLLREHGHEVIGLGRGAGPGPGPAPGPCGEWRRWEAATQVPDLGGADAVVHLAAAVGEPRRDRTARDFARVNVDGARRLLGAVGERPVVWVSSSSVYDSRLDRSLVGEDHPTAGGQLNAYGRTKAAGDRLALAAGAVVLRPRAVYGPGDRHLIPRLRRAVRGGRIALPGGDVRLSLTHVDNLAAACLAALTWVPGPYNVADAAPVARDATVAAATGARVRHLPLPIAVGAAHGLQGLARLTGREPLLTPYAVDTLAHDFVLDTTRARSAGWRPRDLMDDFLAELAADRAR